MLYCLIQTDPRRKRYSVIGDFSNITRFDHVFWKKNSTFFFYSFLGPVPSLGPEATPRRSRSDKRHSLHPHRCSAEAFSFITNILYRLMKDTLLTLPNPYLSLHNTFRHDSIGLGLFSVLQQTDWRCQTVVITHSSHS